MSTRKGKIHVHTLKNALPSSQTILLVYSHSFRKISCFFWYFTVGRGNVAAFISTLVAFIPLHFNIFPMYMFHGFGWVKISYLLTHLPCNKSSSIDHAVLWKKINSNKNNKKKNVCFLSLSRVIP